MSGSRQPTSLEPADGSAAGNCPKPRWFNHSAISSRRSIYRRRSAGCALIIRICFVSSKAFTGSDFLPVIAFCPQVGFVEARAVDFRDGDFGVFEDISGLAIIQEVEHVWQIHIGLRRHLTAQR